MEKTFSPSVCMKTNSTPSPSVIKLLSETLWGTPGGTLYKHFNTKDTIFDIKSPRFFSLERNQNLVCTVCLAHRKVTLGNDTIDADYIRYLAANPEINGNGKRKRLNGLNFSKGLIKTFMEEVFETKKHKSLQYAFVETENEQSIHLCDNFNLRKVRSMDTITFSRFAPKISNKVRRAKKSEYPSLLEKVIKQYRSYNLFNPQHLFYKDNFFVFETEGKIVAGLQSNPMRWSFTNLPGISGKILLNVLPHIPFMKRMLNPKDFTFSAFEGMFFEAGYEYVLNDFFEAVIAMQNNYKALIWLDSKSYMTQTIRGKCKLGLIDKLNDNGSGEVVVRGNNLDKEDWDSLYNTPMYVSSFDFN